MNTQQQILCMRAEDVPLEAIRDCHSLICDPPFSKHVHKSAISNGVKGQPRSRDLGFAHCSPALRRTVARAAANVQRWSCLFSDWESLWLWRFAVQAAGGEYIRPIPWDRWSQPQNSGDRPPTGTECVSHYWGRGDGRKEWNGLGGLRTYNTKSLRGKEKYSCEKPIGLILTLVAFYTRPGDWVLDLCGGIGTTAVACKLLDRNCICVEGRPEIAEHAQVRLVDPYAHADGRDRSLVETWIEDLTAAREAEKCIKGPKGDPARRRKARLLETIAIAKGKLL